MSATPVPNGFHTVTPYLMVDGVAAYLPFLEKAFAATVTERVRGAGETVEHAQVRIGDSMLMMGQATATWKAEPLSLYLFVENADTAYQRALDAGATSLMPPADQFYGDRTSGVKDAWGNTWWISTHLEDVPSDELQRRAHAARQRRAPA